MANNNNDEEHRRPENNNPPPPPVRSTLNSRFKMNLDRYQEGGWRNVAANNFELKPSLITMVQSKQFGGGLIEDPNAHITTFLDNYATVKLNGVSSDVIKLSLFLYSLRDQARDWVDGLDRKEVTTWTEMCRLFLEKYFPPTKVQKLLGDIPKFAQYEDEHLYEAWTRFKKLFRKCPGHGYEKEDQIIRFYWGLTKAARKELDYSS